MSSGQWTELRRTELGDYIHAHLEGGLFIDIPCGRHDLRDATLDFTLAPLAAALGASEMWEADLSSDVIDDRISPVTNIREGGYQRTHSVGPVGTRTDGGIAVHTTQDDLLGFVAKIERTRIDGPVALYVSALQPDAAACANASFQRDVAVPYLSAFYDACAAACHAGDLVILVSSAMLCAGIDDAYQLSAHPALALPPRGFTLMRRCPKDKVHVFVKE